MTGKGVYTFANGDRCVGLFSNGKKEGPGTMFYENGIYQTISLNENIFQINVCFNHKFKGDKYVGK